MYFLLSVYGYEAMIQGKWTVAKIGYFEWRGKHGEFSDSFFSPGKAEAACCRHGRNGKGIAQIARQRVEGAEPPEALEIFPFLRA